MSREDAQTKGRRYLTEGRLTVQWKTESVVLATCKGAGATYELGYRKEWQCDCPAKGMCAHLVALMLVVEV